MNIKPIYIVLIGILISSCTFNVGGRDDYDISTFQKLGAYKINPIDNNEKFVKTKKIIEKNYLIGKIQKAKVGEPVIKIKSYYKDFFRKERAQATDDITLESSGLPLNIYKNETYVVLGTVEYDNKTYDVVPINKKNAALVDKHGNISRKIAKLRKGYYLNILADDFFSNKPYAKILPILKDRTTLTEVSVEYEARYDGMKDNDYYITFMSYAPNSNQNQGSFETIKLQRGTNNIDLNGLKIRVIEVTPEQIEYMVLNDPK